mmetsp:Transcript_171709/g.550348  ORF Transcript_171709/g.550348 Transcript_171709/m.550348 type:complete len:217 (+) Transcript_171709:950-1600(+)
MDFSQYSLFASSSTCSCFSSVIISSTILTTLLKSTCLPESASINKSVAGRFRGSLDSFATARSRSSALLALTCKRLALGSAFLNKSRESSSLRTLIVSCRAMSSSDLVLRRSCHSPSLEEQLVSISACNCWSAMSAASVSVISFFMLASSTCNSPVRWIFFSMALCKDCNCLFLAATNSLKRATASSSALVTSSRFFWKSSSMLFKMPTISLLLGM